MSATKMKLELVQVLFRHGERTVDIAEFQIFNYAGESAYQPWGFGQLTNKGKEQEYRLGAMLRKRYDHFLDNTYRPDELYAITSQTDRTMMSLQCVLAGLYPPSTERDVWSPHLNWTPIPYRYTPRYCDHLFLNILTPRFSELREIAVDLPEYEKKRAEYAEFLKFLEEKTGIKLGKDLIVTLGRLFNVLHINKSMNLPLPDWYTDEVERTMMEVEGFTLDSWSLTRELKRINGGHFIKTFLENMNLDNAVINPRKMYLYSGHDCNLYGVLRSQGIDTIKYTDFASAVILEKLRDAKDQIYVKMLYWDGVNDKMTTLKLGNYEDVCPINEYLKLVNDILPSEEEIEDLCKGISLDRKETFFSDSFVKPRTRENEEDPSLSK